MTPMWEAIYREAFTDFEDMRYVVDKKQQKLGIDRAVRLVGGKEILVDEKARRREYPDILLEVWSDRDRKVRGWLVKPQYCDFIAYAFITARKCYLLPFPTLRLAWRLHRKHWVKEHGWRHAPNRGYVTSSRSGAY